MNIFNMYGVPRLPSTVNNLISDFRSTQEIDKRAKLSGQMNYIKDNLSTKPYDFYHWYSDEFAPNMYKEALQNLWSGRIPEE